MGTQKGRAVFAIWLLVAACGESRFGGQDRAEDAVDRQRQGGQETEAGKSAQSATSTGTGSETGAGTGTDIVTPTGTSTSTGTDLTSCDTLDDRVFPDLTIDLDRATDTITITGTANVNTVILTAGDRAGDVAVTNAADSAMVTYRCVDEVMVRTGDGPDIVVLDGIPGLRKILISGEGGPDTLRVTGKGSAAGTPLRIEGGEGEDIFDVQSGSDWKSVTVDGN